jgi:hypothetical protein
MDDSMWLVFFWTGPIGVGSFLALLGVFILLLAKADEVSARAKAIKREKGLDRRE